jgi:hypothetical protein
VGYFPKMDVGHNQYFSSLCWRIGGLENSVGAYERSRMWILGSVTHKFWFARFISGVHKQVGQVKKPEKDLTIDVIHAVHKLLET